ncbi:MAG TPA: helix-turn-helix domain-containing protein [Actinocrinis sp.]|nr:helix-turn-helix domain-containing protein [Actinocrinis sp.]
MSQKPVDPACPVARTVDIIGDRWSLLIIRDAFDGVRRFSQFQRSLGIAKNILTTRLRDLVDAGVLRVEQPESGGYQQYALTEKGLDLFDLVISLRQWGEKHAFAPGERYSVLVDAATDEPIPHLTYTTPGGGRIESARTRVRKLPSGRRTDSPLGGEPD